MFLLFGENDKRIQARQEEMTYFIDLNFPPCFNCGREAEFRVVSQPDDGEGRLHGTRYCSECLTPPELRPCRECGNLTFEHEMILHIEDRLFRRGMKCDSCIKNRINGQGY